MVEYEKIYKYVGLAIISLFVLYIIIRTLRFQASILEGMATSSTTTTDSTKTDKDKIADAVNTNTTTVEDALLVDKYKKSYEDTIINLENNINYFILGGIVNTAEIISKNPLVADSQKIITGLNNLKMFKDTLNDSMTFLNKTSSDSSSSDNSSSSTKSSSMFSF
jgi:hypothetical protein